MLQAEIASQCEAANVQLIIQTAMSFSAISIIQHYIMQETAKRAFVSLAEQTPQTLGALVHLLLKLLFVWPRRRKLKDNIVATYVASLRNSSTRGTLTREAANAFCNNGDSSLPRSFTGSAPVSSVDGDQEGGGRMPA